MSATYGIAGFVEGFMGGVDKRHEWKDRKRNQERQDRLDKMDADMQERRLKLLDQQITANDKAVADQKFYEDSYKDAVDATKASMAAGAGPNGGSGPAATPGATSGLPPPSGLLPATLPLGLPIRPDERPKVAPPLMPSPAELRAGSTGSAAGVVNAPVVSAPTGPAGGPAPASTPYMPPRGIGGTFPPGPPAPPVTGAYPPTAARPVDNSGADFVTKGDPVADFIALPETRRKKELEQKAKDLAMTAETERRVAYEDGPIPLSWRREAKENLDKVSGETMAVLAEQDAMSKKSPAARSLTAPYKGDGKAKYGDFPAATAGPTAGKAPATAAPEVKAMADTAATAMAETTTPAMAATAEAAARGLPEKPKAKPTEADRDKYAGDFMDHYREVGAPMVYEALISKGEFAKAEAFRQFLDSDATKAGMENWARAAFAASVGDMDTFADEIMEAYDRLDYFPDGTTIVREESGFTRDKAGNITGAKLTFKDEKTGNTFDQVFTDPNDLVRMGITLLAPEQAFEFYFEQQQTAAETARGLQKEQSEADKAQQKRVDDVAKLIFENSKDISGVPQISYGEAVRQAQEQLSGTGGADPAAAGVPVARRPG